MKCAVCGIEFGSGTTCQNCGTDRVTGLGNYNGYSSPSIITKKENSSTSNGEKMNQETVNNSKITIAGSMVCYSCGEIIPDNSKFCPMCGRELFIKCPVCGTVLSSQYLFCNQCGTNINDYLEKQKKKEQKKKEGKEQKKIAKIKEKEEMLKRIREVDKKREARRKAKELKK